ncbi:MAG: GGDEF domain-containing protein [Campylobacterota bacterium]|nr:GGDEF domain-containing protein [Campylobacterota bacterium]
MKNQMIELIKEACQDSNKFSSLENIYALYDQLQYCENLTEMASNLYDWLYEKYKVNNLNFSLFDMETNVSSTIFKIGGKFFLDGELSFYFIINTHTDLNAVLSFSASSKEHYNKIITTYNYIEAAFFQISPILQNGIMKKHHIEASSIDSVTQVYNRKYLIEHINKLTSLTTKNFDKSITFLMIGIDHFKAVIDEFDYEIGDKVLIELAKSIHSNIDEFDIVARLTGDEFLVALINTPSLQNTIEIAQKIIDQFSKVEVIVDEDTQQILKKTICIGISQYPKDSNNTEQVLKNADSFLYEAKNKGRGEIAIYKKEELSSIDLF